MEEESTIQNEQELHDTRPLYGEHYGSSATRAKKIIFFVIVFLMIVITVVLSFYRGIAKHVSYGLLGFSIICIALVQAALVWLHRIGQLDQEKGWFIYFVGICLVIESIFTDVLLFH